MAKTGFNGFPQPRPDRGGTNTGDANASAEDILVTKSGYVRGVKVNGTMPVHSGADYLGTGYLGAEGIIYIRPEAGFWDGLSNTYRQDPNFAAANIRTDKPIFGLAGTMPHFPANNYANGGQPGIGTAGIIYLAVPTGHYDTGANLYIQDPNFIAANIRTDKPMFGLAGTMPVRNANTAGTSRDGTSTVGRLLIQPPTGWWDGVAQTFTDDPNFIAANIRGTIFGLAGTAKRSASGTLTQGTAGNIVVAGLSFTPTKVIISTKNTTQSSHDTVILSSTADLYDMGTFAGAKSQWMYGVIQSGVNSTNGSTQGTINADGFTSTRGAGAGSLVSWWAFE